jgi:LCP family protein required for cell wall assembly
MSETSADDFFSHQAREARGPEPKRSARRRSKRARVLRRIALASGIAVVVGAGAVVGGGYLAVNHLASSVHRIQGISALSAADQPVMPAASHKSTTMLLTGDSSLPAHRGGSGEDHSSKVPEAISGLIAIVHLNANGRAAAVVNLPPNVVVRVPGHGKMELAKTLMLGGPSLLIRTVEQLTNVRINDYSVVDFAGLRSVVDALGGVDVVVPFDMVGEGVHFPKGVNHLTGADVLPYVKQADVSEIGREELQSGLIRAVIDKISEKKLFSRVGTDFRVLDAVARALSVDSNLSDHSLEMLALKLGDLKGENVTVLTAPTTGSPLSGGDGAVFLKRKIANQLWSAIRHDSVAAFARKFPATLTPSAPV